MTSPKGKDEEERKKFFLKRKEGEGERERAIEVGEEGRKAEREGGREEEKKEGRKEFPYVWPKCSLVFVRLGLLNQSLD
jgi:hypothetical protein